MGYPSLQLWDPVREDWVAAPSNSVDLKRDYGAKGDGVTDDTRPIAVALADARGTGVHLLVPPGTYLTDPFEIYERTLVTCSGRNTTSFRQKNASNSAAFVTFHKSTNGTSDKDAIFSGIEGCTLDVNKAGQSSGTGVGLLFDCYVSGGNPATSDAYLDGTATDTPQNFARNVVVLNARGDGVKIQGLSEVRLLNMYVYKCDGNGFNIGTDSWLMYSTVGWAGKHGVYTTATSARIYASKAYYCGQVTADGTEAGGGNGFQTASSMYGQMFVGCEAQDNKANGFAFNSSTGLIVSGCLADSNSTGSNGTYVGMDFWATTTSIIQMTCQDRGASANRQLNALQMRSSSTGNMITMTHNAVGGAGAVGSAIKGGSTTTGNMISINGTLQNNGGAYTVTNPTTDRALDVTGDTTAQVAQVLGTLITDLQANGIIT